MARAANLAHGHLVVEHVEEHKRAGLERDFRGLGLWVVQGHTHDDTRQGAFARRHGVDLAQLQLLQHLFFRSMHFVVAVDAIHLLRLWPIMWGGGGWGGGGSVRG